MNKPILCVDFDGVIHSYDRGWQDGSIYGELTSGFKDWLGRAQEQFDVVVHTSRDPLQVHSWLHARDLKLRVVNEKPPAYVTIDDRALTFDGDWSHFDPEALRAFKPWNVVKEPQS